MVCLLKDDRGELLLSKTTDWWNIPFLLFWPPNKNSPVAVLPQTEEKTKWMCVFSQNVNPNWLHKTVTWLAPEYIFPVISYRPHAMPYLRTEERKEKKMNEWPNEWSLWQKGASLASTERKALAAFMCMPADFRVLHCHCIFPLIKTVTSFIERWIKGWLHHKAKAGSTL